MFENVLADMRKRAAVARESAKNNPDGTVHHEAEAAKMPRVGHGDRFYIVSPKLAKVKGGAE